MRKFKIIGLLVLVLGLCACSKREAIDEDEFQKIMAEENFTVVNVEEQFEEFGYFEEAYVALEKDGNYQLEFYELENEDYTISFYNHNKELFEESKSGTVSETYINLANYNKYTLTVGDYYKVISRIDDTVIYLNVDKQYKDEVNNILEKLGY